MWLGYSQRDLVVIRMYVVKGYFWLYLVIVMLGSMKWNVKENETWTQLIILKIMNHLIDHTGKILLQGPWFVFLFL